MARKKSQKEKYLQKRREQKKLSMRKAQEKLRNDPDKHEQVLQKRREAYKQKKDAGKTISIDKMNPRDKRTIRKNWKIASAKYREKKNEENQTQAFLDDNSPPPSPQPQNYSLEGCQVEVNIVNNYAEAGRKRSRKNREEKNIKIKELEKKLKKAEAEKKKLKKYKNKYYRLKNNEVTPKADYTPRTKVSKLLKKTPVSNELRKKILFGEVISQQIQQNFADTNCKTKRALFQDVIGGKVIEKYKFKRYLEVLTSKRRNTEGYSKQKRIKYHKSIEELRRHVKEFLEQDISSRLTPGKKDTITRNKVKKQKRFLNDSLKNLHSKFVTQYRVYQHISYTLFCRLRPFWIIVPNAATRDTCLCKKHANMSLLVSKLKSLNMIDERTSAEVQTKYSETGEIKYNEYDDKDLVSYHQWSTKSSIEIVRGKEKKCMKTVKEEIKSTKEEIVIEFEKQLGPFNEHCKNIVSQYNAIKELKSNMKNTEALLHFDYSENYGCKYAEEVQSAHFGGSKSQVTLHTSVLYYKNEAGDTVHKCFCTFSASLRHDPVAVCAHLDPVLKNAKDIIQDLDVIHFLSDGPVTQYRNKKMFNLLATYISKQLQVKEIIWHFTEAGHGKGAPDGVGGSTYQKSCRWYCCQGQ
uniref:Uncharacterized protein n=1 Tax=Cacopsylla melanoneura TaxID=428564 RepID=A0A8D9AZZ8_9HEMI